jgi:NAD(P)-dependent dehydrogenase (short-subunit alcohol dehydrogenase family)
MGVNYNPFSLEGKTILVTGASSGIGQACAVEASKMGANVIVCGRNQERLAQTMALMEGTGNTSFEGDLLDQEVIERLVAEVPPLDGVVLSAGRGLTLPIKFSTREKFDDIFNINFFSPVELLRLLTKKKKLNQNCSVVMIVSIGGNYIHSVGNSIYGTSKAALKSMVNFAAMELAPQKIRVNGICPGMVNTPLINRGTLTEEQFKADMERYPLKRYGEPNDIAYGAVYLLSDASSWVTGTSLIIDGGVTAK